MNGIEPTPELPDNTPIREVRFPVRIKIALLAAGLETVGQLREMSDQALIDLPDFERVRSPRFAKRLACRRPMG